MNDGPCWCGDPVEDHIGDDPRFPNPGECRREGCPCLFYEAADDNESEGA